MVLFSVRAYDSACFHELVTFRFTFMTCKSKSIFFSLKVVIYAYKLGFVHGDMGLVRELHSPCNGLLVTMQILV